jgi:coproporphyrinogen III oxidase
MITKDEIRDWFLTLQSDICRQLEQADGQGTFSSDTWERSGGGGGITRVLVNGKIIEKGGVNFSAVWGKTPQPVLQSLKISGTPNFFATGVSIVLHPHNPMVPIIHMNVRYFEMSHGDWWFGGGIDLTPHYFDVGDASYFHRQLKSVCDRHHATYYPEFKKWADDYFYLKHRDETRGIGGIFFDNLRATETIDKASRFAFVKDVGSLFPILYVHFMGKNHTLPFSERQRSWQQLRRGRYVEFNLVWDRGTKFGLDTDGRAESILMSLPPHAEWVYRFEPDPGSPEAATQQVLRKGIDWLKDF